MFRMQRPNSFKRNVRRVLTAILIVSLAFSSMSFWRIAKSPTVFLVVERGQREIIAKFEAAMAEHATAPEINLKLQVLIEESPRNWIEIDALLSVARERELLIDAEIESQIGTARNEDFGWLKASGKCLKCSWDPALCDLSAALLCQVPVAFTPIGDVAGVIRGGMDYQAGRDVDEIDVILSVVGLTAVAAAFATGGSSLVVKAGAGFTKLLNRVGALPNEIRKVLIRGFQDGVHWERLGSVRGLDDLNSLIRPKILNETVSVVSDMGTVASKVSLIDAVYLVKKVDDTKDLRAISVTADALGPKTTGAMAVLGKNRFIRLTMRLSDEIRGAIIGMITMIGAILGLFWSSLASIAIRTLKLLAREPGTRRS